VPDFNAALDDNIGDDLLRLVFISCHPVLSTEASAALTLRLLEPDDRRDRVHSSSRSRPSPANRPAKRLWPRHMSLSRSQRRELAARLSSVLEVIYLVFNEGYSATSGGDWMRPALCEDALVSAYPGRARFAGAGGSRPGRALNPASRSRRA